VIYLHGGPGGSAISEASRWLDHPLREDRDIILLDQRGTGYSEPALCPELSRDDMMVLARDLPPAQATAERVALSLACRDALLERGVDLGSYNSDASAADLVDLRRVLGYGSWNLYGISYGTRLALTALRRSPEGIRSVVLDSAYPPDVQAFNERTLNFVRALKVLFEACASDAACRAAYPDLKESLFETMEDLARRPLAIRVAGDGPLPVDEFAINVQDFLIAVHQMLYRRPMIPLIPFTLKAARTRNREALYGLVDSFGEQGLRVGRDVYNLVECYERGPFGSREAYQALTAEHPRLRGGFTYFDVDQEVCDRWSEDHAGPEEALAVKSDVPSLILTGDYDPITPPEWGRRAGRTLQRSFFFQFPGVGHAASVSHPCPKAVTVAFVRDPFREPDASCIAGMEPLAFVTDLQVSSGAYRLSKALLVERDAGWVSACAAIALALLAGVLWNPSATLIGRRASEREEKERAGAGARWLATAACALALVLVVGLGAAVAITARDNPFVLAFGLPGWADPLFGLPILVAALTVAALILTASAWRSAGWPLGTRLRQAVALLGCAALLALLLGFGFF
jgi:pimeloyl-ACP methyl ester carboxylesterase